MLVFISYWRAAAIVLCDMASTVYYIGGIVEQAIGKAAPWYIGAVMLFAYAVRGVYIESCAMFVRGGVYRVVKEAMGGTLAKLSVSALMFDYVLTGPISGVSAGQYIVGLANELLDLIHLPVAIPTAAGSAAIAIAITLYFWRQNILGIEESSDKEMKIMGVTTVMVVVMVTWCGLTLWMRGATLPPLELHYSDNLVGGLAMYMVGPLSVRLVLRAFVVVVGFLILAGAVNTAIVGSNGVLNRVAEDGVLADWFRLPHRRYGTTHRIIDLVVGLQIFTIIASRGNVYALGEAYAFGVVWSFVFKALSMVMLRFKDRRPRAWRVPLNVRVGRWELPVGLALIFLVLLATALVNLVTKKVATEWGVAFTLVFFVIFWLSERIHHRHGAALQHLEKFNVRYTPELEPGTLGVRPGCKVVPVRDPKNLRHLDRALREAEREDVDIVVPTVKVERELVATGSNPNFTPDEQAIFTAVVDLAEKHGKSVVPLVLTSNDAFFAVARTAHELGAREVVFGRSGRLAPDVQAESFAIRWGAVEPDSERDMTVRIVSDGEDLRFAV